MKARRKVSITIELQGVHLGLNSLPAYGYLSSLVSHDDDFVRKHVDVFESHTIIVVVALFPPFSSSAFYTTALQK